MSRRRDYPNLLTTLLGMSLNEIEWTAPKVTKRDLKRMRQQADWIGKIIADDWLRAAKSRLVEIGLKVAADEIDQQRRDRMEEERAANERELSETQKAIDRMVEAELPALRAEVATLRKRRAAMGKAVKRERAKLEAAAKKVARLKLARLRGR
jgi:septal ring factor EnvC (AmiA/AmiB activator)